MKKKHTRKELLAHLKARENAFRKGRFDCLHNQKNNPYSKNNIYHLLYEHGWKHALAYGVNGEN